jgi:hypothetical protein
VDLVEQDQGIFSKKRARIFARQRARMIIFHFLLCLLLIGIGRITKHLLTRHFKKVDLVEQDRHFLEKAREYLRGNERVGTLYCAGLQHFEFTPLTYDVIWCQWVLGHLTDEHLVSD